VRPAAAAACCSCAAHFGDIAIRQALIFIGSVAFLLLQVLLWGLIATGSPRAAMRYFRDWSRVIGITLFAGAVGFLIVWSLIGL
jgi:hypothetical protein